MSYKIVSVRNKEDGFPSISEQDEIISVLSKVSTEYENLFEKTSFLASHVSLILEKLERILRMNETELQSPQYKNSLNKVATALGIPEKETSESQPLFLGRIQSTVVAQLALCRLQGHFQETSREPIAHLETLRDFDTSYGKLKELADKTLNSIVSGVEVKVQKAREQKVTESLECILKWCLTGEAPDMLAFIPRQEDFSIEASTLVKTISEGLGSRKDLSEIEHYFNIIAKIYKPKLSTSFWLTLGTTGPSGEALDCKLNDLKSPQIQTELRNFMKYIRTKKTEDIEHVFS